MKESFLLIAKGFIVGLGKVIPGVSGAVLAIMLKVYEPILDAVVNIRKELYKNLKYLATIGIGLILAIVLGSKVLLSLLEKYPLQAFFPFIGVMLNGVIPIFKEAKKGTTKDKLLSFFIIIIVISLSFIKRSNTFVSSNIVLHFLLYFLSGILDAASSIVPGISGTVILMLLGTYRDILFSLGNVFSLDLISFNFKILFPFFAGMLSGLYLFSKLVHYLFKKHYYFTYNCIAGFCAFSILSLFLKSLNYCVNMKQLILSFVLMFVGYWVSKKVNIS